MVSPFSQLKEFSIRHEPPTLIGGIGQGGQTERFVVKFGTAWKRTPIKGVYFIAADGCQFTLRGDDCAWYDFATVAKFKHAFNNEKSLLHGNAQYFPLTPVSKYSAVDIMKFLAEQGIDW